MSPDTKRCARCGENKSRDEFSPHSGSRDARHSHCRECRRESDRRRRQSPDVRAQQRAYQRTRRQDPEKAAADRVTSLAWKKRNPKRTKEMNTSPQKVARNKAWAQANRERRVEQAKAYQARNPEVRVNSYNRRRDRLSNTEKLTASEWRQILADFNYACAYCLRVDRPLQQEHVTPLAKGGRHNSVNVVPACADCNYQKHTRNLLQFVAVGGALLTPAHV